MAYMKCYGKYVANDPCAPFCSKPDGSGCDYGAGFGLTEGPYSVTYSDQGAITGNTDTRVVVPVIDPYQAQTPPSSNSFSAETDHEYLAFADNSAGQCAFAQATGTAEYLTENGQRTNLTTIPRYSTARFFEDGEVNGIIPRPKRRRGRRRVGEDLSLAVLTGADGSKTQPQTKELSEKEKQIHSVIAIGLLAALGYTLVRYLRD